MAPVEKDIGAIGSVAGSTDAAGVTVIELIGEIDISNADALGAEVDKLVGADAQERLVIDLGALEFMDSSGIALLIRAAGRVDAVEIRNPSEVVRRIIECTGLGEVLRISP
jgi:anti-anti-sigma factor